MITKKVDLFAFILEITETVKSLNIYAACSLKFGEYR